VTWELWPSRIRRCWFVGEMSPRLSNAFTKCIIHDENQKTCHPSFCLHSHGCTNLTTGYVIPPHAFTSENIKVWYVTSCCIHTGKNTSVGLEWWSALILSLSWQKLVCFHHSYLLELLPHHSSKCDQHGRSVLHTRNSDSQIKMQYFEGTNLWSYSPLGLVQF
jgi:hypothetical protein